MIKQTLLYVALLHDDMLDKQGHIVSTSLTLIDIHDIARSTKTYGVERTYIAHSSPSLRKLAKTLHQHWEGGFGSSYNPDRKDALENVEIVSSLDECLHKIDLESGKLPKLIATSAARGDSRISFSKMQKILLSSPDPHLLMLGTGWGMSSALLKRADYFLAPIEGPSDYNHLSVRSACAIMLDRLLTL